MQGKRTNAIVELTSSGVIASEILTTTVNGDAFFDFLRGNLLPMMQSFEGTSSNSVLIMDNCLIHHVSKACASIQELFVDIE